MRVSETPSAEVFVSVVAVVDERSTDVEAFTASVHDVLERRYLNFELVLVLAGASNSVVARLRELVESLSCIRVLRLSEALPIDAAMFAGLQGAIGDCVVTMVPGQDPVEALPDVVDLVLAGHQVVQGISTTPLAGDLVRRTARHLFQLSSEALVQPAPPRRATYLVGLSRAALSTLTTAPPSRRQLRRLVVQLGHDVTLYPYALLQPRQARRLSGSDLRRGTHLLTSYSSGPLRAAGFLTLVSASIDVVAATRRLRTGPAPRSCEPASSGVRSRGLSGTALLALALAVQSEYLGLVLSELRGEPHYFAVDEFESPTSIAHADLPNVDTIG